MQKHQKLKGGGGEKKNQTKPSQGVRSRHAHQDATLTRLSYAPPCPQIRGRSVRVHTNSETGWAGEPVAVGSSATGLDSEDWCCRHPTSTEGSLHGMFLGHVLPPQPSRQALTLALPGPEWASRKNSQVGTRTPPEDRVGIRSRRNFPSPLKGGCICGLRVPLVE